MGDVAAESTWCDREAVAQRPAIGVGIHRAVVGDGRRVGRARRPGEVRVDVRSRGRQASGQVGHGRLDLVEVGRIAKHETMTAARPDPRSVGQHRHHAVDDGHGLVEVAVVRPVLDLDVHDGEAGAGVERGRQVAQRRRPVGPAAASAAAARRAGLVVADRQARPAVRRTSSSTPSAPRATAAWKASSVFSEATAGHPR